MNNLVFVWIDKSKGWWECYNPEKRAEELKAMEEFMYEFERKLLYGNI